MDYQGKRATRMTGEFYSCGCKEEEYTLEEVWETWTCPDCRDHITIYAESAAANDKGVFYRKRAKDAVLGDLVKPGHLDVDASYELLGISAGKKGKLAFGLKGYRRIDVHPEEWVSIRMGGW